MTECKWSSEEALNGKYDDDIKTTGLYIDYFIIIWISHAVPKCMFACEVESVTELSGRQKNAVYLIIMQLIIWNRALHNGI